MAEKINIGMAGVGGHGGSLRNAIFKCEDLKLISVFDPKRSLTEAVAQELGCEIAGSYEELVADERIAGVVIASPNEFHREQVEKAAEYCKHIFVEKPIANTVADAVSMLRKTKEAGVLLQIGHNTRRSGIFRQTKSILEVGTLGQVVAVEGNLSHRGGMRQTPGEWRYYKEKCPALPLIQLGIHTIDTMIYLLGPIRRISSFHRHSVMPGENDDVTNSILEFESGVLGNLGSYYVTPLVNFINIYGTDANLFCRKNGCFLERFDVPGEESIEVEEIDTVLDEIQEFADCIRILRKPETAGEEGLAALAVVEAAILSSRLGRAVSIDEVIGVK